MNEELDIEKIFTYHSPTKEQATKYQAIRSKAKELAEIIVAITPYCCDQEFAIRKLRECVQIANASIALNGEV